MDIYSEVDDQLREDSNEDRRDPGQHAIELQPVPQVVPCQLEKQEEEHVSSQHHSCEHRIDNCKKCRAQQPDPDVARSEEQHREKHHRSRPTIARDVPVEVGSLGPSHWVKVEVEANGRRGERDGRDRDDDAHERCGLQLV